MLPWQFAGFEIDNAKSDDDLGVVLAIAREMWLGEQNQEIPF